MNTNQLYFIVLIVVFALISCGTCFASNVKQASLQTVESNCSLKYGWSAVPPYIIATKPEPSGYQIDFIRWIASELNCKLSFVELSWAESLRDIADGRIDLIGRSSKTTERSQWAYFSESYDREILVMYMRFGERRKYDNAELSQLLNNGFRLGILKDAYYGRTIDTFRQNSRYQKNFVVVNKAKDLTLALSNRVVDGIFEAPYIVDSTITNVNSTARFDEYPIEIITGEIHFMLSKKSLPKEFVKKFNDAIGKVKQSPAYLTHPFWSSVK